MTEKKRHILLVDDEEVILTTLDRILTRAEYQVTKSGSGRDALEKIDNLKEKGERFDLLLTDIKMPGMSGIELIDELADRNLDLPVVGITAYGDKEMVVDLLRRGCTEFIEKPCSNKVVIERIQKAFEKIDRERAEQEERTARSQKGKLVESLDVLIQDLNALLEGEEEKKRAAEDFDFSSVLRKLREIKGVKPREVANATAISPGVLCSLETTPDKSPTLKEIRKLSEYYQIPASYLVFLAENTRHERFPDLPGNLAAEIEKMTEDFREIQGRLKE